MSMKGKPSTLLSSNDCQDVTGSEDNGLLLLSLLLFDEPLVSQPLFGPLEFTQQLFSK